MSTKNDETFGALRADDTSPSAPDSGFAARLRRQVESALDTSIDTIHLTPRKETTMTDTSATAPIVQTLTPYITVHDGPAALDWYVDAMGATEHVRYVGDDGRLGHAEFSVSGAKVMMSDAYPEMGVVAANSYEGSSCALHLEVTDCDAMHARAVERGATSTAPPADQPHGARSATIIDPFGHRWMFSQQKTALTSAEIDAAYEDFTVVEK